MDFLAETIVKQLIFGDFTAFQAFQPAGEPIVYYVMPGIEDDILRGIKYRLFSYYFASPLTMLSPLIVERFSDPVLLKIYAESLADFHTMIHTGTSQD